MKKALWFLGLDVHAKSLTLALADRSFVMHAGLSRHAHLRVTVADSSRHFAPMQADPFHTKSHRQSIREVLWTKPWDEGTTEAAEGTSGGWWAGEPFPPNPLLSGEHLLPTTTRHVTKKKKN